MNVLISGAGIGGTAAALFLGKIGITPTLLDKAPSFQKLGYILSLKNFGLSLMKELGLLEELRQRGLPYSTFRFYRPDDTLLQEYPKDIVDRITQGEVFVYRSDLHDILYRAAQQLAGIRFGVQITAVHQNPESVHVVFSDGREESFDALVISEGLRSSTRTMLWGAEGMEPFDIVYTAATMDRHHGYDRTCMSTYFGLNNALLTFPITEDRLVIQSYLRGQLAEGATNRDVQRVLIETFGRHAPRVVDLLKAMRPEEYVFHDNVAMVMLPALNKGRVALLGDAGYCPTFLSGMGASLALLGAKALSQAFAQYPADPPRALAGYNASLQKPVRHFHENASRNANLVLQRSQWKLALFGWMTSIIPPSVTARKLGKQFRKEKGLLARLVS